MALLIYNYTNFTNLSHIYDWNVTLYRNLTDFEKGETRLVTLCGVTHTISECRNSETVESREKFH